jgi:hypothetical protein
MRAGGAVVFNVGISNIIVIAEVLSIGDARQ